MTTARRVGGLLKRLFKFAASRDIIESDPAAALMLPGAEKQRERTLTEAELKAFWLATDPVYKAAANATGPVASSHIRPIIRGAPIFGFCSC